MISAVSSEAEWHVALQSLPQFTVPEKETFVIAPHPDDETLGTGGLISFQRKKHLPVRIIAVTDGEAAYKVAHGLRTQRIAEQEAAASILGVMRENIIRLHLPDSGLEEHEADLVKQLISIVPKDCFLLAPWLYDFHPDHEVCGRASRQVVAASGTSLAFYFFWTWHRATPAALVNVPLRRFELNTELQQIRTNALEQHQSQLHASDGNPILPSSLLGPAFRSFETLVWNDEVATIDV
jgi:LmbE family N-acetylglucosaminyl deacetylase